MGYNIQHIHIIYSIVTIVNNIIAYLKATNIGLKSSHPKKNK